MGAVVKFVEDVVTSVVEVVGAVVEAVSEVVTTVANKVVQVVEAVVADPIPTLLAIGGQMIGIPAPVTMAAITAARGGDLEDIVLSAGAAYLAPTVGNSLSSTFSSTLIEAGVNETVSDVLSSSVSKGLVNGTIAEIKGGDFEDAFAGGFTGGLVSGGVKEVGDYVKPDVIALAQESGLDLKDANAAFNATQRAFTAGITSEITGKNDFTTAFTNSAIGSTVDYGVGSLNNTIDKQFRTAATDWNEKDKESPPVEVTTVGQGVPDDIVTEVKLSDIGTDSQPMNTSAQTFDFAQVLSDTSTRQPANSDSEINLAEAPKAENASSFSDLIGMEKPKAEEPALGEMAPEDLAEVGSIPSQENETDLAPKGGLASVSDVLDLSKIGEEPVATSAVPVISEAPLGQSLTATGLAPETPQGGLNAVAGKTPEEKMAESQGLKATDITKPLVTTAGSLLKSTLMQKKPAASPQRPVGGLQAAQPAARPVNKPPAPPQKMDVAKLIPIQKATPLPPPPVKKPINAPAQRLDSTAKLTPIQNIAGLTSTVKKTG